MAKDDLRTSSEMNRLLCTIDPFTLAGYNRQTLWMLMFGEHMRMHVKQVREHRFMLIWFIVFFAANGVIAYHTGDRGDFFAVAFFGLASILAAWLYQGSSRRLSVCTDNIARLAEAWETGEMPPEWEEKK